MLSFLRGTIIPAFCKIKSTGKMNKIIMPSLLALASVTASAQNADNTNDSIHAEHKLQGVTVKSSASRRLGGAINGMVMGRQELFKAACCNLGESFQNNASVDVNYSDATTGAKQIKLLGLAGTYVQMLTENLPNYRGVPRRIRSATCRGRG